MESFTSHLLFVLMELPVKDVKNITTSGAIAALYFSYSVNWGLIACLYAWRISVKKHGEYWNFLPGFLLIYQTHSQKVSVSSTHSSSAIFRILWEYSWTQPHQQVWRGKNNTDSRDFTIAGSGVSVSRLELWSIFLPIHPSLPLCPSPPPTVKFVVAPGATIAAVSTCLSTPITVGDAASGEKWNPGHRRVSEKPARSLHSGWGQRNHMDHCNNVLMGTW